MTIGYSIDNARSDIANGWHAHGKFPTLREKEEKKERER